MIGGLVWQWLRRLRLSVIRHCSSWYSHSTATVAGAGARAAAAGAQPKGPGEVGSAISNPSRIQDVVASGTGCRGGATASTSKRRRTSDPGWASLPEDLVRLIASRLLAAGDLLDYVRLRAVCRGWRSGTDSPRGRGVTDPLFHPRRWMMLPEGHGLYPGHSGLGGYASFLSLDTGRMVRGRIPLLQDTAPSTPSTASCCCGLRDLYNDSAVRLLHPFTGDVADHPPLAPLLPQLGTVLLSCPAPYRLKKLTNMACAAASFGTRGGGGAITIVLALHQVHRVAFASSLDEQWTLASWPLPSCHTPFPFRGKLYILHTPSQFMWQKCTPGSPD